MSGLATSQFEAVSSSWAPNKVTWVTTQSQTLQKIISMLYFSINQVVKQLKI